MGPPHASGVAARSNIHCAIWPRFTSVCPRKVLSAKPETIPSRHCYVCKEHFTTLHHFYDQLCPTCAEFNFAKRTELADLTGRVDAPLRRAHEQGPALHCRSYQFPCHYFIDMKR